MLGLLGFVLLLFCCACPTFPFPASVPVRFPESQEEHFKFRDAMIQAEREYELRDWKLSEDERVVDQFLAYLKWKDLQSFGRNDFPPSKPIEKMLHRIQAKELFEFLRKMPKGGNLHSHEDHQLSKRTLFDIVWNSQDFDNLYIVLNESSPDAWMMDFFINPPKTDNWIKVKDSNYTKEQLLAKNTLLGLMTEDASNNPTDASKRWALIDPLWLRGSTQLISNVNVKGEYLRQMFEQSMSEGITYLETRRSFGFDMQLYRLDPSGGSSSTFGKKFLDPDYATEVTLAQEAAKNFSSAHPGFIGHRRISYAVRFMDHALFDRVKNLTINLHNRFPDHVMGFDLVAEEDSGYSNLYYLDQFLSLHEYGTSRLPIYIHTAETSWPDDLLTSPKVGELVPTLQNAYEAVILKAQRIGHGKGFVKKPFLREVLKERRTAVEICVVSNQILGMDVDIRNHYGQILHKEGVPIVLAPDDPGTFGYDNVTVDWYMAYLGWGLNLGDLKQIALNSLLYSAMNESEKLDAVEKKWRPSWNSFVKETKCAACAQSFNRSDGPAFYRLLPNRGRQGTRVHLFGRNFESAICRKPTCKFGRQPAVEATYVSNQELTCVPPECPGCGLVSVNVSLSDPNTYLDSGLTFHYDQTPPKSGFGRFPSSVSLCFLVVVFQFVMF